MEEIFDNTSKKSALLMLSGGRDSFYSACKLVKKGYYVYMVTYDNGHTTGIDDAVEVGERIEHRFGKSTVHYLGTFPIAQRIMPLLEKFYNLTAVQVCSEYPNLVFSQINCLACHTVMYWHSIALCKAMNISILSEGARKSQGFFIEQPEMKERYENLCKRYNIQLELPAYELDNDLERKRVLADWRFHPKTCESQCWLGCPMHEPLSADSKQDLARYFDREILPNADSIIDLLIPVMQFDINASDNDVKIHSYV